MAEKIGVYVCHCGSNIAGKVDVGDVGDRHAEPLGTEAVHRLVDGAQDVDWARQMLHNVEGGDGHHGTTGGECHDSIGKGCRVGEVESVCLDTSCGERLDRGGIHVRADVLVTALDQWLRDCRVAATEIDHYAHGHMLDEQADEVSVRTPWFVGELVLHGLP